MVHLQLFVCLDLHRTLCSAKSKAVWARPGGNESEVRFSQAQLALSLSFDLSRVTITPHRSHVAARVHAGCRRTSPMPRAPSAAPPHPRHATLIAFAAIADTSSPHSPPVPSLPAPATDTALVALLLSLGLLLHQCRGADGWQAGGAAVSHADSSPVPKQMNCMSIWRHSQQGQGAPTPRAENCHHTVREDAASTLMDFAADGSARTVEVLGLLARCWEGRQELCRIPDVVLALYRHRRHQGRDAYARCFHVVLGALWRRRRGVGLRSAATAFIWATPDMCSMNC